jgi:two-component system, chemotaxis family, sensor histidine kinase and response regulator WspE
MHDPMLFELFIGEFKQNLLVIDDVVAAATAATTPAGSPRVVRAQFAAASRAAHALKGAARIMDLLELATLCGAIENVFGTAEIDERIATATVHAVARTVACLRTLETTASEDLSAWANQYQKQFSEMTLELSGQRVSDDSLHGDFFAADTAHMASPTNDKAAASIDDLALHDLFASEVESHVATMTSALLSLEREPGRADFASLMRSAHSIKGAARIVDNEIVVGLAHVMEDCFVAAQSGANNLSAADVDTLLRAVDTMTAAAAALDPKGWFDANGNAASRLIKQLGGIAKSTTDSSVTADVPQQRNPKTTTPPAERAVMSPAAPVDRSVRVAVESVNRLMNLAGESLVETRRLEGFVASLYKLSRKQAAVADQLTQVYEQLTAAQHSSTQPTQNNSAASDRLRAMVATVREAALDCRKITLDRMNELDRYSRRAEDLTERLYQSAIASRMRPFEDGIAGFPRLIRDLARRLNKSIDLVIVGDSVGVDRDILEKLDAPLNHLLRNAADHGLENPEQRRAAGKSERGQIRLEAKHWAGMLTVTVADDGRGISVDSVRQRIVRRGLVDSAVAAGLSDAEVLDYLFVAGFSTSDTVTEVSGRGVGLDVVRSAVEQVGGSVRLQSQLGSGTTFQLQLPLTLSVVRSVLVEIAGEPYAFPMMRVERIAHIARSELRTLENRQYFLLENRSVGLVAGHAILELPEPPPSEELLPVVILSDRANLFGVAVDRFIGEDDLVVRALDPRLGKVADISAAAMMTDGTPVLVVDVEDMLRSIVRLLQSGRAGAIKQAVAEGRKRKILVVDDSITVREVQRQLLEGRGYQVVVAVDGLDGWNTLRDSPFDLVISDVDMPRMNGIELVRSIKQDSRLRDMPVMIVSYRDRDEDRKRGLDAGANYYFAKSDFHDVALLEAVNDLIGPPQ